LYNYYAGASTDVSQDAKKTDVGNKETGQVATSKTSMSFFVMQRPLTKAVRVQVEGVGSGREN
jgi:hypothetical protein